MLVMVYSHSMTSIELVTATPTTVAGTLAGLRWEQVAGAWLASFGSANTREAYRRDLTTYAGYLVGLGIEDPLTAGRPAVDMYARHLEALGRSASTRARNLAAIGSFYGYASTEGLIDRNPAASVRRPKVSQESPRLGMTADEARRVIAAAEVATPAHRAIVGLCLFAGLRISEALAVTPADLRTEAGHTVVSVLGKGGKLANVPLAPQAVRLLEDALTVAETDGGRLIRGTRGTIDRHQALRMVEALGRTAGLGHALRPHDCRHACATLSLEAGAPLHRVQDLLRHSSPVTTQRYTAHRDRLDGSAAYNLAGLLGA